MCDGKERIEERGWRAGTRNGEQVRDMNLTRCMLASDA
jgi:hypothetical protein